MRIRAVAGDITQVEADAAVVNLFEGIEKPGGAAADVDHALDGAISALISRGEIKGKAGEVAIIHTLGRLPAGIVAVAGLGKSQDFTVDRVREVAGDFSRALRKLNCRRIATVLHGAGAGGIEPSVSAEAIAEGALLGLYSFDKYRKPEQQDVEEMLIVVQGGGSIALVESSIDRATVVAEATSLARTMVNEPSNYMTPGRMAYQAEEMASRYGLALQVLEVQDMEAMGMEALLGVAKGSSEPPKMMVLSYKGDEHSGKVIGFLGKGITFDSGGISIKPSEGMGEMKQDMAGAATAMAALGAVAGLKLPINATAVIPATENLPSGTALKPGDVLRAMNGKTIEVISTDAEGRLILADALSYAHKLGLSPLIDLATLTGACRVALGTSYAGLFSNNQALADEVLQAAGRTGERMWQMPMPEEYKELLKSEIADIKNGGFRLGGAIMAALFLAEFASDTPWVHIDIAGPASSTKESGYLVKGGTGFGVRTLVEFAFSQGRRKETS
jgi:leucyl aminopeptidase